MMKNRYIGSNIKTRSANPRRRTYHFYALAILICLIFAANVSAQNRQPTVSSKETAPLHLGLLPHLSSHLLIKKYQKLIIYLEKHLQRRIIVQTAPNFNIYTKRAIQGRYDLYLTAPHLAAFLESKYGHKRVVKFSNRLRGVIVVARDSAYQRLSDLRGKVVAAPDELSVSAMLGEVTFLRNQINPQTDLILKYTPSHNNALHAVALGKADAAIAGLPAFKITTAGSKLKRPLRILSKTHSIPQMMFMTPARVSKSEREKFKQVLLNITNDATGKAFVESVPFGHFSLITDRDMQELSDFVLILEQRLKK